MQEMSTGSSTETIAENRLEENDEAPCPPRNEFELQQPRLDQEQLGQHCESNCHETAGSGSTGSLMPIESTSSLGEDQNYTNGYLPSAKVAGWDDNKTIHNNDTDGNGSDSSKSTTAKIPPTADTSKSSNNNNDNTATTVPSPQLLSSSPWNPTVSSLQELRNASALSSENTDIPNATTTTTTNMHIDNTENTLSTTTTPMVSPPPAAAVVLEDNPNTGTIVVAAGGGGCMAGAAARPAGIPYPVATFVNVRDWVITSIFDPPSASTNPMANNNNTYTVGDNTNDTAVSSIRSTESLLPYPTTSAAANTSPHRYGSDRTHHHDEELFLQEEFIVVDGDLIAIPANMMMTAHADDENDDHDSHGNTASYQPSSLLSRRYNPLQQQQSMLSSSNATRLQQQGGNNSNSMQSQHPQFEMPQHPSCQPKKMRRGMRTIAKLFQRGAQTMRQQNSSKDVSTKTVFSDGDTALSQNQQQSANSLSVDLAYDTSQSVSSMQQQQLEPLTMSQDECQDRKPNASSYRKSKKEKKSRVGWVQRRFKGTSAEFTNHDAASQPSSNDALSGRSEDHHFSEDHQPIPLIRRSNSLLLEENLGLLSSANGLEPPSTTFFRHKQSTSERGRFAAAANSNGLDGLFNTTTQEYEQQHPPPHPLRFDGQMSPDDGRTASVTASYVGTADSLMVDGVVLPDASITAESFLEDEMFDLGAASKKEDTQSYLPMSLVAEHADLKVDKAEGPDVEAMLRRAVIETTSDLEAPTDSDSLPTSLPIPADMFDATAKCSGASFIKNVGKSDDSVSIPLSQAQAHHTNVHNDTLKVVMVSASSVNKSMVARSLRSCTKRPRKRTTLAVDVHEWLPSVPYEAASTDNGNVSHSNTCLSPIKCMIWDVQGASLNVGSTAENKSNFGTHPGTQSLFFSPQSLYLLCWDLACNNPKTNHVLSTRDLDEDDSDFDEDDDEDEYGDDFVREEANRHADRALHADISHRVLSWFDCISRSGPKSAILPVALVEEGMSEAEVKRRCEMMRILLEDHYHKAYDCNGSAPKLLTGTENSIMCVNNFGTGQGMQELREMVAAIANDKSNSVFEHIGTSVPNGTVLVHEAIRRFKEEHKLILLDHLMGELGHLLQVHEIVDALHFLSNIGEILYFGTNEDDVLSRYVILSRKWLISALSCILRNDLKRELIETRRFMNMQCIYSDQKYEENEITRALVSGKSSSCPLLSDEDAKMLWQSMSFMREASDRYSDLLERSATAPTMFYFLERLLVNSGVFLPLGAHQSNASLDQSEVFFVPSLLAQADPTNMWTYMTGESWMTTLCHSWLFRDGAPPNLMEHVTVRILRDLYQFSKSFHKPPSTPVREPIHRVHTVPMGRSSFDEFIDDHIAEAVGTVHIHHVMCFQSSMLIKIGTIFSDEKTGVLRESVVEVFVAVVDQTSTHTVASDVMRPCMQRVVVSGKGQAGRHGHKLWKGGYKLVLDAVRDSLENMPNLDSQAICPECLATGNPRIASTWSWDVVLAAALSGNPHVICLRGHRVNSNLICGTCQDRKTAPFMDQQSLLRATKSVNIKEALPSVVLVGVWDPNTKSVVSMGSGFIVDKKTGLIVTAGHVLFNLESGNEAFGKPYFGCKNARAIIGVIPTKDGKTATFRYFAEIVAHDVHNVDACVLQIRSRMEKDVDDKEGIGTLNQREKIIGTDKMMSEDLRSLKLTKHFDIAESVRLLGYSQEGEGIFEEGKHISPSIEFVEGKIRRHFKATMYEDNGDSDSSSSASGKNLQQNQHHTFAPREEIVMHCLVNSGHSGGPCVNADGKVVGILSRSDPVERDKCYLVPTAEIRPLILKAKAFSTPRPARITSLQTV